MQRRLLLLLPLHLPAEFIQRLDMPEAFAGDGAEGQGAEEIHKKDFRDTELQSLLKGFQRPAAAPVVDGGQGVAGQVRATTSFTVTTSGYLRSSFS